MIGLKNMTASGQSSHNGQLEVDGRNGSTDAVQAKSSQSDTVSSQKESRINSSQDQGLPNATSEAEKMQVEDQQNGQEHEEQVDEACDPSDKMPENENENCQMEPVKMQTTTTDKLNQSTLTVSNCDEEDDQDEPGELIIDETPAETSRDLTDQKDATIEGMDSICISQIVFVYVTSPENYIIYL